MDEEFYVVGPGDYVDIFVAEFVDDAVYSASAYSDACAYGIDSIVEAFDGYFGSFAWDACYAADCYEAVVYFGDFEFEESFQEFGCSA